MLIDDLNENTIEPFMMRVYDNPQCTSIEEFQEDIKRIKYIKRLFNRYLTNGELKERLILNHIIVLYNVFGIEATRILFYKMDKKSYSVLVTFLIFLGYVPDRISGINGKIITTSDILLDNKVISKLRKV
mgnify:CR=1 FL=1